MLWISPALTVYICVLTGILGACMGSFLNCMAWRIVHGESVLHGRSHCDVCGHVLGAGDLIPVVSYIIHKGRCKYCGAKLSAGHVFAEVLTALTFLLLVLKYDISLQALEYILLACLLLAAAFTDLEGAPVFLQPLHIVFPAAEHIHRLICTKGKVQIGDRVQRHFTL